MYPAMTALLGALQAPRLALVEQGFVRAPLSLSRAQVTSRATARGTDDLTWAEFLADEARRTGNPARLLIEGQRSNGVANPRAEGAVAGSPGTLPTGWAVNAIGTLSRQVIGAVTVNGLPGFRCRFHGTNASGSTTFIEPAYLADGIMAAAAGTTYAHSVFLRLAAGSLAGVSQVRQRTRISGSSQDLLTALSPALDGTLRRHTQILSANAGATFLRGNLTFDIPNGSTIDFTLDVIAPQAEAGPFASTPILPAAGAPAAAARGSDVASAALAACGIAANGPCTLLCAALLPQAAPAGSAQALLQLDDGTANNRTILRNEAGGVQLRLSRVVAGTPSAGVAIGSVTAGTPFRFGLALDSGGRTAVSLDGAAAMVETGTRPAGLNRLVLGSAIGGVEAMFGQVATLRILPQALGDAALASATAAL